MTGSRVALEVITFGTRGFLGSRVFTSPSISVGRDPDAMCHLDDPSVSLKHAVLFLVGDAYYIKDLGSRTGTLVNGAPASPLQAIDPTDEIAIGAFRLRVTVHKASTAARDEPRESSSLYVPTPFGTFSPVGLKKPADDGDEATGIHRAPKSAPDLETTTVHLPVKASEPDGLDVDGLLAHAGILDELLAKAGVIEDQKTNVISDQRGTFPTVAKFDDERDSPSTAPILKAAPPASPATTSRAAESAAKPQKERSLPSVKPPVMKTVPLAWTPARAPVVSAPARTPVVAAPASPAKTPLIPPPARAPILAAPVQVPVLAQLAPAARAPVAASPAPAARVEPAPRRTDPLPTRPAPAVATWAASWDEDDDDDANFVPPFDLLDALSGRGLRADSPQKREAVVEVIRFCRDRVISVRHLGHRRELHLPGSKLAVGRCERDGSFALDTKAAGTFSVRQGGRSLSPHEAGLLAGAGKLGLAPGMQITIDVRGEDKVLVHLVPRAADIPKPSVSFRPKKDGLTSGASSAMFHLAVLVLVGTLFLEKKHDASDLNEGRFATIALKEIELEPPPAPPPPEVVPQVETAAPSKQPEPQQPPTHAKPTPASKAAPTNVKPSEAPEQPAASTAKILSALGSTAPSTLTATAITNLDAAPHAAGGFKVSGAIGKAPGDTLRIAGAGSGSGQLDTKSAVEIGTKVGHIEAQAGTGVVRARVTNLPPATAGEGHLDRGEIQRVVNAHVQQVQGCYERQLMKDPSLSGKITLEWVIAESGGVSSVRVKQSSVHSTDVASCIQSAIQGWKFPSPQGGSVTVTYPFAFSTLGN